MSLTKGGEKVLCNKTLALSAEYFRRLKACNISEVARRAGVARQALHRQLKDRNPTIESMLKISAAIDSIESEKGGNNG